MANITTWLQDYRAQKTIFVLSILIPMGIFFGLFYIFPLISGFLGSLTDWRAFVPERPFIGFDNYEKLFRDDVFLASLKNTLLYLLMYLPASMILALILALAINAAGQLTGLFRTMYFLPVVT